MKYIKVTLSELVGRGVEPRTARYYLIPQEGDFDDEGVPIFSEELIRRLPDTRKFCKLVKNEKVLLDYKIYEANVKTEPEVFADFEIIEDGGGDKIKLICGNDFIIDVNRKMKIYGGNESVKRSSNMPYIVAIVAIVAILAAVLLLFPHKNAPEISDVSSSSEISESEKFEQSNSSENAAVSISEPSVYAVPDTNSNEPQIVNSTDADSFSMTVFDETDPARTTRTRETETPSDTQTSGENNETDGGH